MEETIIGAVQSETAPAAETLQGEMNGVGSADDAAADRTDAIPDGADGAEDAGKGAEGEVAVGGGAGGGGAGDASGGTEQTAAGGADGDAGGNPSGPSIVVKYNKQRREIPFSEAAPYVEMGMKYESFKPAMEKLRFLAQTTGCSVEALIGTLADTRRNRMYEDALALTGGNEAVAGRLADLQYAEYERKHNEALEAEKRAAEQERENERAAQQSALENKLADGFIELSRETGGRFREFRDVPGEVLRLAVRRDIPLYDAWLRYEREQEARSRAVLEKQEKAAGASAGSLGRGSPVSGGSISDVFSNAFHNAVFND